MKSAGDSECPCGAPTVKMKGADMVLSILMVIFVSDSTSHMIQSMLRNEYKMSRSFFKRIVLGCRKEVIHLVGDPVQCDER